MEMEIDEIFFTLGAKKMLLLFCTWKESLQTGCQETVHSLFFWVKAYMWEKKEEKKTSKQTCFFYLPLPMNIKLFWCLLFIMFLFWEFETEIYFNIILFCEENCFIPPSIK